MPANPQPAPTHIPPRLFRRQAYLRRPAAARAALLREQILAPTLLAASLWLALKFEACRTLVPDASLMHRITGEWGLCVS